MGKGLLPDLAGRTLGLMRELSKKDTAMTMLPWSRSREDHALKSARATVVSLTDRMRQTADELEQHERELNEQVPHVGLGGRVYVDTGNGCVEAMLVVHVDTDAQGRCILDGRLLDRRSYARSLMKDALSS